MGFCDGVKAISDSIGNGKSNQRIQLVMDDDLAKIKEILETLAPGISVVEFIPPAPPVEDDEERKQQQQKRKAGPFDKLRAGSSTHDPR